MHANYHVLEMLEESVSAMYIDKQYTRVCSTAIFIIISSKLISMFELDEIEKKNKKKK